MKGILVSSSEPYSGKSALIVGLSLAFKKKGYDVGFMKPVGNVITDVDGILYDEDTLRIKGALALAESAKTLCPILQTDELLKDILSGKKKSLKKKVKSSYAKLSAKKDIMFVEGLGAFGGGAMMGLSDIEMANLLDLRILLIVRYDSTYAVDRILKDLSFIKDKRRFLGVIINDVKPPHMEKMNMIIKFLEKRGVHVLGVLPRDNTLASIVVADIVQKLGGRLLAAEKNTAGLVKNIVVGAMEPANALRFFRGIPDKVVVSGGDRSEILIAALETSTKCLVLTGNLKPTPQVLGKAEDCQIPVILVSYDTASTVHRLEELMMMLRISGADKIQKIKSIVEENVDLTGMLK